MLNTFQFNFITLTMNKNVEVCTFNDSIKRGHMTSIAGSILRRNTIDQ